MGSSQPKILHFGLESASIYCFWGQNFERVDVRASWRPRHDGAQAPRFSPQIRATMALTHPRGEGATVPGGFR